MHICQCRYSYVADQFRKNVADNYYLTYSDPPILALSVLPNPGERIWMFKRNSTFRCTQVTCIDGKIQSWQRLAFLVKLLHSFISLKKVDIFLKHYQLPVVTRKQCRVPIRKSGPALIGICCCRSYNGEPVKKCVLISWALQFSKKL